MDRYTRLSTDNTLHGNGRAVEKRDIPLQLKKRAGNSEDDLKCHVFSLEDTVAHLAVRDPSRIGTSRGL